MSTRITALATIICSLALAAGQPLAAQSFYNGGQRSSVGNARRGVADPAEYYLGAYQLIQEAEKLAERRDYRGALRKGRDAERLLAAIVRDFPNWKPNLVQYRRTALARNLATYQEKAKEAPAPTRREPGSRRERPTASPTYIPPESRPSGGGDDESAESRMLRQELARSQEEVRRLSDAYKELSDKAGALQQRVIGAELESKQYKQRYAELQQQVETERTAGNQVVDSLNRQLAEMSAKYHAADQARQEAENRIAELNSTLEQTRLELEKVTLERDTLKQENEQLHAIVDLNSPEKTKALLDQNLTLDQKLKEAQNRVHELEAQMEAEGDERSVLGQQLQAARQEADRLREEMTGLYDENMAYRNRVSTLTERLNNLEAELEAQAAKPTVDPALAEENQVLREVIAKQKRTLGIQAEGRRLLIETYKQMKNADAETLGALKRLEDESNPDLTDAERRVVDSIKGAEDGQQTITNIDEQAAQAARAVRAGLETEALATLAQKAFSKKRYTAAEQLYRTLVDSEPDNVPGLVNLGTILLYRNRYEDAVEYLARAQRLSPNVAVSYYLSALCQYRLDHMEEARRLFARTIELDPANAESFFYLANIEGLNGEHERALKHYAAAIKLKPAIADAHYNMARIYAEAMRIPDAARAYDRAIHYGAEPDPEFEDYLRNHPDNTAKPGADLVESVTPEAEAEQLRAEDTEMQQMLEEHRQAEEAKAADAAAAADDAAFDSRLERITRPVPAAPSASPAGNGHETASDLFSQTTIRKSGKQIQLRLKKPEPRRIRKRGGDIQSRETK